MIIYGINPVVEAIRTGRATEVMTVTPHGERVRELVSEARVQGVPVRTVDQETARRLAQGGVHQGVVARTQAAPEATLEQLAAGSEGPALIVVLDGVEDPNNVGRDPPLNPRGRRHRSGQADPARGAARRRRGQGLGRGRASRAGRRCRQHRPVHRSTEGAWGLDGGTRRRRQFALR